jgi:hypothetical protein
MLSLGHGKDVIFTFFFRVFCLSKFSTIRYLLLSSLGEWVIDSKHRKELLKAALTTGCGSLVPALPQLHLLHSLSC